MASLKNRKKRSRKHEPFHYFIEKINDGKQSRNDWSTRPLISLEPVYKNVYIANCEGVKEITRIYKGKNIAILNLQSDIKINDNRVNNISIEDSLEIEQDKFNKFIQSVSSKISQLSGNNDWIIVNCRAGINRASAAVLGWMVSEHKMTFNNALIVLKKKKADAAKFFQFKNRYQSFDKGNTINSFSWPTLSGAGSTKLKKAIMERSKIKFLMT